MLPIVIDRLKGKKKINTLFKEGYFLKTDYLGLRFLTTKTKEKRVPVAKTIELGVCVGKRNISKAVDRNLIKRRMREAFIKNENCFNKKYLPETYIMILFLHSEILSYQTIEEQLIELSKKFKKTLHELPNVFPE